MIPFNFPYHNNGWEPGKIVAIAFDGSRKIYQYTNDKYKIRKTSDISMLLSPTHFEETLIAPNLIERKIEKMVFIIDKDAQVDGELLEEYLKESIQVEQQERKFDRFAGNMLGDFTLSGNHYLAYPRGPSLNSLEIAKLEVIDDAFLLPTKPVLECTFQTPIKQSEYHHEHLLVRTYQGIHLVSMEGRDDHDIETEWQPRHVASNSRLKNQIAVLGDNGFAYIWDIQRDDVSVLQKYLLQAEKSKWATCTFGDHPFCLLLANTTVIKSIDQRSKAITDVYSSSRLKDEELFTALKRHPTNPFELAFASNKSTLVLDTRNTKVPLLHWSVNNPFEEQFNLEFLEIPSGMKPYSTSCLYNWGRHIGETLVYNYEQSDKLPPVSTLVQKLDPFYDHKFYLDHRENIHPPVCIEPLTFYAKVMNKENQPPWPALLGCKLLPNSARGSDMTLFQFTSEGSLFGQSYRFQKQGDPVPPKNHDLALDLHYIESEKYMKMKEIAQAEMEKNEEADNVMLDFSYIWRLCEQKAKQSKCMPPEAKPPKPKSTTVNSLFENFPNVGRIKYNRFKKPILPSGFKCSKNQLENLETLEMDLNRAELINIQHLYDHFVESLTLDENCGKALAERHAMELLQHDIILASRVIVPMKGLSEVEVCDGTGNHKSTIHPMFMENSVALEGMSSWLHQAWDDTEMEPEETNSSRARSASPSSIRSSSVRVASPEPRSSPIRPTQSQHSIAPPTIQIFSQQSILRSSQTQPSQSQKPKRKRGF